MTHTKEPWAYRPDADDDWGIIRAPVTEQGQWLGGVICQARDPERLGESELAACRVAKVDPWEANARRIVDCINALAGIENPAAFVAAFEGMVERLTKLERWFDTDPEILDAMSADERADNARQLAGIRAALTAARAARATEGGAA